MVEIFVYWECFDVTAISPYDSNKRQMEMKCQFWYEKRLVLTHGLQHFGLKLSQPASRKGRIQKIKLIFAPPLKKYIEINLRRLTKFNVGAYCSVETVLFM